MDKQLEQCWLELKPSCEEIARLIHAAPLPENDRAGLAAFVAAHFFGVVAGAMDLDPTGNNDANADTVCRAITDIFKSRSN